MNSDLPQTLSPALPTGHLLKEYSLLSVLGMGSFGITYLAADNYLQLKVAIKEYFPSNVAVRNQFSGSVALKSEQSQAEYLWGKERFMREAQTLARFSHKNIVQVFRYFEGNGTCYMVMAYEEGMSLEQVLAETADRWDEPTVLALVMPLLEGLESVHAAGFLHRDIKPANIVLRAKDDSPVLIDFGAARSPTSTDALTVILSHGYGPPEQYSRYSNQGPWTDIYAMAGVLYRIVTGAVPPPSLHRVKNDAMIPTTFSGEGRFSAGFLGAIDLALSVDETRRPQSIGEWRRLLVRGVSGGSFANVAAADQAGVHAASSPAAADLPAKPASGRISPAVGDVSPSRGRAGVKPSAQPRRARLMEEASEPGLPGRLGQAMIAHPFLALLLLVAALFVAMFVARRPVSPERQNQAATPAAATQSRSEIPRSEPAVIPPDRAVPVPAVAPPVPVEVQAPPRNEPAPRESPNDSERRRGPLAEAFNACAGKAIGASCSFIDRRNESLSGTCTALPNESPVCRPERFGERRERPSGPLPYRQNADLYPADNRPPRYR